MLALTAIWNTLRVLAVPFGRSPEHETRFKAFSERWIVLMYIREKVEG